MSSVLISPLFPGIALALVLALVRGRAPRWLRRTLIALLVLCYLLATPLLAEPLLAAMESAARTACHGSPQAVVVLAGGGDRNADRRDYASLNLASMRRLIGAVELWRRQPGSTALYISGGSGRYGKPESPRMASMAHSLGVPDTALHTETRSRTTWQNAQYLAAMHTPRRVWLVTSAVHMRRARFAMRQAGFSVCPAPVDYRHRRIQWLIALLPSAAALDKTDAVLHELAGMAWYRLKAWRGDGR